MLNIPVLQALRTLEITTGVAALFVPEQARALLDTLSIKGHERERVLKAGSIAAKQFRENWQ